MRANGEQMYVIDITSHVLVISLASFAGDLWVNCIEPSTPKSVQWTIHRSHF